MLATEILNLSNQLQSLSIFSSDDLAGLFDATNAPTEMHLKGNPFPNLRKLSLPTWKSEFLQSPFLSSFAESIRQLTVLHDFSDTTSLKLPPRLEFLNTMIELTEHEPCKVLFESLPSSLQRILGIRIQVDYDEHVLEAVPRHLQFDHLQLWNDIPWSHHVSLNCPSGIESLDISIIDFESFASAQMHWTASLPPQLKSLSLGDQLTFDESSIVLLPTGITSLDMSLDNSVSLAGEKTVFSRFPNLTSLTLDRPSGLDFTHPIPESVTLLSGSLTPDVALFTPQQFHLLPSKIESLHINWVVRNNQHINREQMRLPTSLRSLYVDCWHENWLDLLPKSLTVLAVSKLDLPIENFDSNVDYFAYAPPALERLYLSDCNITTYRPAFSGTSFSRLNQLKALIVGKSLWFEPTILATLAQNHPRLRSLDIAVNNPSDQHMASIPPHLTSLSLKPPLTIECAQYWPLGAHVPPLIRTAVAPRLADAKARSLLYPDPRAIVHLKQ